MMLTPISAIVSRISLNQVLFVSLVCLSIAFFFWDYISTGGRLYTGDFDYYAQIYEAFRISILKFNQLPLWNPWLSGGMPLLANPQFGLVSIQSILVLIFGTVFGLKLAYILYAIAGFFGMYFFAKRDLGAEKLRAVLVAYIWVFCGFFAEHSIGHFTFTLFYLLPWLLLLINRWHKKNTWLYLGGLISLIILSSIHYAFLMMSLVLVLYVGFLCIGDKFWKSLNTRKMKEAAIFGAKTIGVIFVLAGYRFLLTYMFVHDNQRPAAILNETAPNFNVLFQALFLPTPNIINAPQTQWSWGEYSMYLGIGTGLALIVVLGYIVKKIIQKKKIKEFTGSTGRIVFAIVAIGLIALLFARGDFGTFSPYNILHKLPGFTETRVSSRWLIFSGFSILVFIAAWRSNKKIINLLLLAAVVELFVAFGPMRGWANLAITPPQSQFSSTFKQQDNNRNHTDIRGDISRSYFYSTSQNIGNLYGDDSIINTLNGVLSTARCGENVNPKCDLVLSDNATITYWSPNKIVLKRTAPGAIELNMNREKGWKINDTYPFVDRASLDPSLPFIITDITKQFYTVDYQPKFSPPWLLQKLHL